MSAGRYILVGRRTERCDDLMTWARWMEGADRLLQQDWVGPLWVSTVFLGLDHNFSPRGKPILFESAILEDVPIRLGDRQTWGLRDIEMRRAHTWEEAMEDHRILLARAHQLVAKGEQLLRVTSNAGVDR